MYKLVYNYRETEGREVIEREYNFSDEFRLKKDAILYLSKIVQSEFVEDGYRTEQMNSGTIHCYRSELTTKNELKVIEWTISVKKV